MDAKILVVEDNEDLQYNIKILLEINGYLVETAENGKMALQVLKNNSIDFILSDIMMPEMDGYEFYQEVSSHPLWNRIPFVFLSAKGSVEDVRLAKKLGVDDYITKPFQEEDLLAIIEGKLRRYLKEKEISAKLEQKLNESDDDDHTQNKIIEDINKIPIKSNLNAFFYVLWDEKEGPYLVDYYPRDKELEFSLDEAVLQLFMISESLFSDSGDIKAQGLLANIGKINRMAYMYFDKRQNNGIRSGNQPFMLAVISPNIHYLASVRILEHYQAIAKKIKKFQEVNIKNYGKQIEKILKLDEKYFNEIWIVHKDGLELVSITPDTGMHKDLVSGFIAAIQQFSMEINNSLIQKFFIADSQFVYYSEPDRPFFIVGKADKNYSENVLLSVLGEIFQIFWKKYRKEISKEFINYESMKPFRKELKKHLR